MTKNEKNKPQTKETSLKRQKNQPPSSAWSTKGLRKLLLQNQIDKLVTHCRTIPAFNQPQKCQQKGTMLK